MKGEIERRLFISVPGRARQSCRSDNHNFLKKKVTTKDGEAPVFSFSLDIDQFFFVEYFILFLPLLNFF